MLAIADPRARLRLIWIRLRRAARTAASVSGSSTSSAMTTPTNDGGKPTAATPASIAGDSTLARPDDGDEREQQQAEAGQRRPPGRRAASACSLRPVRRPRPSVLGDRQEEVAVPDGLGDDEQRRRAPARPPPRRRAGAGVNSGPLGAGGERRQHQAQRGERATVASAAPVPSGVEQRDAVPHGADQQREADDAVEGDHHRGEHGVAGQRRGLRAAGDHQGDDQRHLDHGDGDREDQRAERLADPVGDDLRVVHRGEHGSRQHERDQRDRQRAEVPPQVRASATTATTGIAVGQADSEGRLEATMAPASQTGAVLPAVGDAGSAG